MPRLPASGPERRYNPHRGRRGIPMAQGFFAREIAMTRLDRHVHLVRTKLFLATWLACLAWALLAYAGVVLLAVAVDKFLVWRPPAWEIWFWSGLGIVAVAGSVWAYLRRPTAR